MGKRPGVWKLYKSSGAAAFSLLPPRFDERGYVTKHGGILLEVAPSSGRQQWDWDKKIKFAISIADICCLLEGSEDKRRIFHKHNDNPKVLHIQSATDDRYKGTFMLSVSEGQGDRRSSIRVPLTGGEHTLLMRTLVNITPLLLNWTEDAVGTEVSRRNG